MNIKTRPKSAGMISIKINLKVYPMLRKMSIQWEQRSCRFVSHLIRMFNRLLESKWKDGQNAGKTIHKKKHQQKNTFPKSP